MYKEEDGNKLQEIISLLLAAGYFRARIQTLTDFDKIVGGMAWCIEMCDFDIDIDLFFQENLSIGQKIALTERIVAVIQQMNCPHRIEPHQIQGCDIDHIFPVLQWLVKKGIEFRSEHGDKIRSYSLYQYQSLFKQPNQKTLMFDEMVAKNLPKRQYRPKYFPYKGTQQEKVKSTLLEFGEFPVDHPSSVTPSDGHEEDPSIHLTHLSCQREDLSRNIINSILANEVAEIREVTSKYSSEQNQNTEHVKMSIENQLARSKAKTEQLEKCITESKQQYKSLIAEHEDLQNQREKVYYNLKECQDKLKGVDAKKLKTLKSYILKLGTLKENEKEFREHCYTELERWKLMIKEARQKVPEIVDTSQFEADLEKHERLLVQKRIELAKKSQEVFQLRQNIDEVPSRSELYQYQQRFLELYNMISNKHRETKQFYLTYNMLMETQGYLSKELSLLNSILDNYNRTSKGEFSREDFLFKFSDVNQLLKTNLGKLEDKNKRMNAQKADLSDQYLQLLEVQRNYARAIKNFTEEYQKNEMMLRKLNSKN